MGKLKIFFYLFCFIIVGEILIRITSKLKILEENRIQKIEIAIEESDELDLLNNNSIDLSDSSLRILVIGDSYIHGGGISESEKFSRQLRKTIKMTNRKYKNVFVLDVSKPDANNLDNMNSYFNYKEKFMPQIVILGYHFNDINGNLDESKISSTEASGNQSNMKIWKITDFLYHSAFLQYVMPKFNNILLSKGYIIPKSRLDNTIKYYSNNHKSWKESKILLEKMIKDMENNKSKLIVYHFAYTNLIEYPDLFLEASHEIERFFTSFNNVYYISGIEQFRGKKASDYFIYKYDGHPNALAHKIIAEKVNQYILSYTNYKSK